MLEVEAYGRILKFDAEKREWSSDSPEAGLLLEWLEEGMRKHRNDYRPQPDATALTVVKELGFKVLHRDFKDPDPDEVSDPDVIY